MVDIAQLGIEVDSKQVVKAKTSLDDISGAAKKAEAATKGMGTVATGATKRIARENERAARSVEQLRGSFSRIPGAVKLAAAAMVGFVGAFAGILAGLLGVGGGIVLGPQRPDDQQDGQQGDQDGDKPRHEARPGNTRIETLIDVGCTPAGKAAERQQSAADPEICPSFTNDHQWSSSRRGRRTRRLPSLAGQHGDKLTTCQLVKPYFLKF